MSQQEAIQTFQTITETANEAQARDCLDRSDWDVVAAVNLYYAQTTPDQIPTVSALASESLAPIPPPVPPVPERPRGWLRRTWAGFCSIGAGTLSVVAGVFRSLDECQSAGLFGSAGEQEVAAEVLALVRSVSPELGEMAVEIHGYRRAMLEAEMRKRPLVAYLHSESFTLGYLREVVFTAAAVSFLRDNFTLLLLDPSHPDFSRLIQEAGRPFIPVLVAAYPVTRDQQAVLGSLASFT